MMKYVKGVSLLLLLGFMLASNVVYAVTQRTDSLDCSTFTGDVTNTAEGWSWNNTTKTLTLNGVDFKSNIYALGDSNIVINGINKIGGSINDGSSNIKKELNISGSGTINFIHDLSYGTDDAFSLYSFSLYMKDITINTNAYIYVTDMTLDNVTINSAGNRNSINASGNLIIKNSKINYKNKTINEIQSGMNGDLNIINSDIRIEGNECVLLFFNTGTITDSKITLIGDNLEGIVGVPEKCALTIKNSKIILGTQSVTYAMSRGIEAYDISILDSDILITGVVPYGILGNKITINNSNIDASGTLAAICAVRYKNTLPEPSIDLIGSLPVTVEGEMKKGVIKDDRSSFFDIECYSFTTNNILNINAETNKTTALTRVTIGQLELDTDSDPEPNPSTEKTAHTLTAVAGASHTLTIEGVKYGDNIEVWNNATDRGKGSLIAKATAKNPTPNAGDTSYVNINIKGDKLPTDRKVWYTVSNKAIKSKANITPVREEKERDTGTAVTFAAPYTLSDVTATIINNWQNKSDIVLIQNVNPGTTVTLYYYASSPSDSKIKPKDKIKSITVKAGKNYASFDGIDTNKGTVWVTINQEKKNASGESGRKMLPVVETE